MKLALLVKVEAELHEAAAWYDEQREGLGDKLLLEVHDALAIIMATPETWARWPGAPPRLPPIRRFLLHRFPYAIACQARPSVITVLAIVHGRRRPLHWASRAP